MAARRAPDRNEVSPMSRLPSLRRQADGILSQTSADSPGRLETLLGAACSSAGAGADPWVRAVIPADEMAAGEFRRMVAGYNEIWERARTEALQASSASLAPRLFQMDLAASILGDFLWMLDLREKHGQPILWDRARPPGEAPPTALLQLLFAHLTNTTVALRRLVAEGMTLPAKVLFRQLSELGDMTLALAADFAFFGHYRAWTQSPDQSYAHWKKHLAPKKARAAVAALTARMGFDGATRSAMEEHRAGRYAWLSGSEHSNPVALLVDGIASSEDAPPHGSLLGGRAGAAHRVLAEHVNYFHYEFVSLAITLLIREHGWTMPAGERAAAEMVYRWRVLQSLYVLGEAVADRAGDTG
ncbi:MAG: hypothetical protein JWM10_3148 [Myxococcaceae bacterium]|nr:hypothetical protein [Myxococcaceae bacterium]